MTFLLRRTAPAWRLFLALIWSIFVLPSCRSGPSTPDSGSPIAANPPPGSGAPGQRESASSALTVESARGELRQAIEDWVAAIRAGQTEKVRALIASEDDLRTFVQEAQLQIIIGTRRDRTALLDRLVNSARDQPVEIVAFDPGECKLGAPGGDGSRAPTANFDFCKLRLSYGGLEVGLDLLHPMRFPSGWKVLEVRKQAAEER